MISHPDAEEIGAEEFELHWAEFDHRRRFREQLPNPWQAWEGRMIVGGMSRAGARGASAGASLYPPGVNYRHGFHAGNHAVIAFRKTGIQDHLADVMEQAADEGLFRQRQAGR